MSTLVVALASATLFAALQALWWTRTARRHASDVMIADRLGFEDSQAAVASAMRAEEEGWAVRVPGALAMRRLLDEAGKTDAVATYLGRSAVYGLGAFAVLSAMSGSLLVGLALAGVCAAAPWIGLASVRRKRYARIAGQLPEALDVMAISLRAGHSLRQTLHLAAHEMEAPVGDELKRVSEEIELGRTVDQALIGMAERLRRAPSVRTFVVSVVVLRQTGGNLIEVLDTIIDTLRQQHQYQRKLHALTAEGRASARLLAALPVVFAGVSFLVNPEYISVLFTDPLGRLVLFGTVALYLAGLAWVRQLATTRI